MKYLNFVEIVKLCASFFIFGVCIRVVLSIPYILKGTFLSIPSKQKMLSSAKLYMSKKEISKEGKIALNFSFTEFFCVLLICIIFFLISYFYLDGEIRMYTFVLMIFGYLIASKPCGILGKYLSPLFYPILFLIKRAYEFFCALFEKKVAPFLLKLKANKIFYLNNRKKEKKNE